MRRHLGLSLDCMRALKVFVETTSQIPLMAHYPIIRTVVESCATGFWLLDGGTKQKVTWNSIRAAWASQENADTFARAVRRRGPGSTAPSTALSRLKELQAQLPAYRTHQISALPKISAIVERLDQK